MRPSKYPGQTVLHALKVCDILKSNIVKRRITVVKFATNKCNSFLQLKETNTYEYGDERQQLKLLSMIISRF